MLHIRLIEKVGDSYRVVGTRDDSSEDEEGEEAGDANMEEGNPTPFVPSSGAGTSGAGPSYQGTSNMSNDEVLARMMSRMDMFDTCLNGMEFMIADRFQSIASMHGSCNAPKFSNLKMILFYRVMNGATERGITFYLDRRKILSIINYEWIVIYRFVNSTIGL
ncbi:hypothetical protein JCGZ_03602 [Jatropha curcas]|uniref:Uncharacterized protein n=1 Tax=Jatropha curcas TaxID=180498 RepID=A0A067JD52_JATCU|nr:hypothetical protein JCGZ_03602 [Jatropha curcas]